MCKTETISNMARGTLLYSACCVENGVYDLDGIYERATKRQDAPWGDSLYLAEERKIAEGYVVQHLFCSLRIKIHKKSLTAQTDIPNFFYLWNAVCKTTSISA